MADAEALAAFLAAPKNRVPADPEAEAAPERALVNVARRSRRMAIRQDMVPREGSGRRQARRARPPAKPSSRPSRSATRLSALYS